MKNKISVLKIGELFKTSCKLRQFPNKFCLPKLTQEEIEKLSRLIAIKVISILKSMGVEGGQGCEGGLETKSERNQAPMPGDFRVSSKNKSRNRQPQYFTNYSNG